MLVQFGNNWIQKIALVAKLDSACGLVQFWLSSEFFSSNYFQIGQHVVLLHKQIKRFLHSSEANRAIFSPISVDAINSAIFAQFKIFLLDSLLDRFRI